MERSNSGNDPTDQDSIDLPSDALRLGTDHNGAAHHYSRINSRVFVIADGELELTMGVQDLAAWIEHVDGKRGWSDLRYSDEGALVHIGRHVAGEVA